MKISKYGTFGVHQDWVDQYLLNVDTFWSDNLLGVKQVPSFKAWLKDAEIIDEKGNLTEFGELCVEINQESNTLLWELIYINLTYNSPLLRWYIRSVEFNREFSRKNLDQMALEFFRPTFTESTVKYAIQALLQTFRYSPIGDEFMQLVAQDIKGMNFMRTAYQDLSIEAVAYSMYRYGADTGLNMFRVSDLYRLEEEKGAYRQFGLSKNDLLKSLRSLSSDADRVLIAELTMGLDHVTLREDLTPLSALKQLLK